jgi:ElaB/YqjD/DUF883 family membrane-anchored ribosome-binding protein
MEENKNNMMDQAADMAAKAKEMAAEKLGSLGEDAKEMLSDLTGGATLEGAKEKASELASEATEAFNSAKDKVSEMVDIDNLTAGATEKLEEAKAAMANLTGDATEAFNSAKDKISEFVNEEKLNEFKNEATEKLGDLKDEAEEALSKAKEKASEMAGEAGEAVQEVAQKAKGFFSRLFGGK